MSLYLGHRESADLVSPPLCSPGSYSFRTKAYGAKVKKEDVNWELVRGNSCLTTQHPRTKPSTPASSWGPEQDAPAWRGRERNRPPQACGKREPHCPAESTRLSTCTQEATHPVLGDYQPEYMLPRARIKNSYKQPQTTSETRMRGLKSNSVTQKR